MVYNGGAYSGFRAGLAGSRDAAGGQYHIPHFQVDSYMVYTNNVPCGSYRAPGQPQVVFAVESHTDMIAHEMGIDPYALRLRNVLQDGQVCATGGGTSTYGARQPCEPPSKPPTGVRRSLARMLGGAYLWGSVPRDRACTRSPAWMSMPGQRSTPGAGNRHRRPYRRPASGGGGPGIPVEDVTAVQMDMTAVPRTPARAAAAAGRDPCRAGRRPGRASTTHLPGRRVWLAGRADRLPQGSRVRRGDPDQGVPIQEVASRAVAASGAPISFAMTTEAKEPDVTCFSAQVAEVEVDPETGAIKVRKFVTAHDVGTIHNPMTHQGQIDGAIMQGVGYALMEQLASEEGHISTLSMGEVKTPHAGHARAGDGAGGVPRRQQALRGEDHRGAAASPVAPAIANAVYDAVGVRIQDLPITAEKVLAALQKR